MAVLTISSPNFWKFNNGSHDSALAHHWAHSTGRPSPALGSQEMQRQWTHPGLCNQKSWKAAISVFVQHITFVIKEKDFLWTTFWDLGFLKAVPQYPRPQACSVHWRKGRPGYSPEGPALPLGGLEKDIASTVLSRSWSTYCRKLWPEGHIRSFPKSAR